MRSWRPWTMGGLALFLLGWGAARLSRPTSVVRGPVGIAGDLDGDGRASAQDLDILLQSLVAPRTQGAAQPGAAGDLNGDGRSGGLDDAVCLARKLRGEAQ